MGLETAMGKILPCRQGRTVDLGRLAAAVVVEAKGQSPDTSLSVREMPLQSPR